MRKKHIGGSLVMNTFKKSKTINNSNLTSYPYFKRHQKLHFLPFVRYYYKNILFTASSSSIFISSFKKMFFTLCSVPFICLSLSLRPWLIRNVYIPQVTQVISLINWQFVGWVLIIHTTAGKMVLSFLNMVQ